MSNFLAWIKEGVIYIFSCQSLSVVHTFILILCYLILYVHWIEYSHGIKSYKCTQSLLRLNMNETDKGNVI